jgi:hypothetical protein
LPKPFNIALWIELFGPKFDGIALDILKDDVNSPKINIAEKHLKPRTASLPPSFPFLPERSFVMHLSTNDRRRVLLIDCNSLKRQVRAAVLRSCEVEVHMADSVADAGSLWTRCSYDLVLLAAEEHSEEAELLCGELRKSKPRQRIALLVGAPQYVCEVGRKHTNVQSIQAAPMPKLEIGSTREQRTRWQGTVERLLAAEASISIKLASNC